MKNKGKLIEELGCDAMEFFTQSTRRLSVATRAHMHDAIEILYAVEGDFRATVNDREMLFSKGDIILFRSNHIHYVFAGEEREHVYHVLKLSRSKISELFGGELGAAALLFFTVGRADSTVLFKNATDTLPEAVRLFLELAEEAKRNDSFSEAISERLASEVLLHLMRAAGEESSALGFSGSAAKMQEAAAYISENFASPITEEQIASMLGLSIGYFSRSFKRITGKSFKGYLNQIRINRAESLLALTDKPIATIAKECGYESAAYFISVYRRLKGKTPGDSRSAPALIQ